VHEGHGEIAVVGHEEQSLAGLIQPADGIDALFDVRQQVDGTGTAAGIAVRAEMTDRLVHDPVNELLRPDRVVIDGNLVGCGVDPEAEVFHSYPINLHAPGADERIAESP
jgi:hypothetical protein